MRLLAGSIGMMLAWGAAFAIALLIPGDQGLHTLPLYGCLMPLGFAAGYTFRL